MRYFYKPKLYTNEKGIVYECRHPVYSKCTLYLKNNIGMGVIQQRYDPATKHTWWSEIDSWMVDDLYFRDGFGAYFDKVAKEAQDGIYPTVTVRQLMWALKVKPLRKMPWETTFDHSPI